MRLRETDPSGLAIDGTIDDRCRKTCQLRRTSKDRDMSSLQGQPGGDPRPDSVRPASSRKGVELSVAPGTKALMVEDDQNSRFALSVLLERVGITVIAATNG
jgi:hypothetical protein